jgi:hypothetical protein
MVHYYCESARLNRLHESLWWEREKRWRLGRVGLTAVAAEELWQSAQPSIAEAVHKDAEKLKEKIEYTSRIPG